jgi:hypothetical protein
MLVAGTTITFAQCPIDKGQIQLNAGIGSSFTNLIPFYVGLDYGIYKDITLGGNIVYGTETDNEFNQTLIGITANANYHFNSILDISNKWDIYTGLDLGYNIWSISLKSSYYDIKVNANVSAFVIGVQVGARYYFTNKFRVNIEFGTGTGAFSDASIGVS